MSHPPGIVPLMSLDATEMAAAMRAALRDREEAWRVLSRFAADWRMPLRPGDGCDASDLGKAEERLGLRLPAALREAHLLLGRRDDLCRNQDRFLPAGELYVREGALVYAAENQGCALWGVRLDDLGAADPPAVVRPDLADTSAQGWEPWADRLSAALIELVMSETLYYGDGLSDAGEMTGMDEDAFEPLPAVLPDSPGYRSRWLLGDDALLHVRDGSWVTVRVRSREAFDAVRASVTADWVNWLAGAAGPWTALVLPVIL